jgi:GNAT superfamily N-acetyltransferase
LNKNKIKRYARKCVVKEIDKIVFQSFCNQYHIQGANHLAMVCYGLFYNDELIGGMSFGKHHRNGKELTLDRLCFKDDISVIGGSSKLFSACLSWAKLNGYKHVISWSDNRWSAGGVYVKLGFDLLTDGKPDYSYVDLTKKCNRRSKQSQKKHAPSVKTERQMCIEKGLARIWDCGKKKWIYKINI